MRKTILLAALFCAASATAQTGPDSAANIRATMAVLASDRFKGRETGTKEFDAAADYVAAQMKALGLKPGAGGGSYFQPVPLVASRAAGPGVMSLADASGRVTPLAFGKDFVNRGMMKPRVAVSAQVVFVGYGVVAPERGRDDYRGLDVKGKVVAYLFGAPAGYQTEERAYYSDGRTKQAAAAARGAIATITISTPIQEGRQPFANTVRRYQSLTMTWRGKDGRPFDPSGIPALGGLSRQGAEKLFAGAPLTLAQIYAAAGKPDAPLKGFALRWTLRADLRSQLHMVESRNVIGILPGSDPRLKNEHVALSAHLDHLGVSPPEKGDSINNGALDNAAGVATTLEVARLFAASGKAPRRSVLFLIDTGEEKGLLGAEYFARNPTVPLPSIVGAVDLDMPILTYDFTDATAFGADRSSIGPAARRAAARLNIKLSPDPMPDEGIFTRSDHYRFVQVGVPAVLVATGYANGGEAAWKDFLKNHYHKPSDDLSLPIRYDQGAKFARLNYGLTRELTDAQDRPVWNKGDFFGAKYAGGR